MIKVKQTYFLFFIPCLFFGQVLEEKPPPDHINTVIIHAEQEMENIPIVELGKAFTLRFDDLNANEAYYYYTIQHANSDWSPTDLFKSEYLDGFDDIRIRTMSNSSATLQGYTHYTLTLPNRDTRIVKSGNYLISIHDESNKLVFSRRFVVFEKNANVQVGVFRLRSLDGIDTTQRVEIGVRTNNLNARQPEEEILVWVLQNYKWASAKKLTKPDYIMNQTLRYEYGDALLFEGGNEYFFFDTKDQRSTGGNVAFIRRDELYQTILYPNFVRNENVYTHAPDINGNFSVQTTEGYNPNIDADYTLVTFSLRTSARGYGFYVSGMFNNHQPQESHQLVYSPTNKLYHVTIPLKQGIYNYKFIATAPTGELLENAVSGSHWETENDYLALVYFRKFGERYDRLVGIGIGNSTQIQN